MALLLLLLIIWNKVDIGTTTHSLSLTLLKTLAFVLL